VNFERCFKRARCALFDGNSVEYVAFLIAPECGTMEQAHLIVRAAEVDIKMRRKPDATSVRLPLRRRDRRRGIVTWTRRPRELRT
jgi:hypothetical protein